MHATRSRQLNVGAWPDSISGAADMGSRVATNQGADVAARTADQPARWGMAIVLLLLGYEWLLSGLNKVLSSDFLTGLGAELQATVADNPNNWYAHLLARMVIPHAWTAAALVEGGEIAVALGLFAGAALWLGVDRISSRWARTIHPWVIAALIGSALMTANYYFLDRNSFPWLRPSAPFDEGLNIDGLLTLVSVALIVIQFLALHATTADFQREEREDSAQG
ncbi:MAG: hypothetical protein ACJ789_02610 [Thermomicrobiales bacterium]